MARNRELSQFSAALVVDDHSKNVGIATTAAPQVGIGTTNPAHKLDVYGEINSTDDVKINGTSVLTTAENDAVALAIALG